MDIDVLEALDEDLLLNETSFFAVAANDSSIPAFRDAPSIAASVLCFATLILSSKVLWSLHHAFHISNLYTIIFSHVLTGCFHALLYAGVSLVPRRMIRDVWLYMNVVEYEAAIQEALSFVSTSMYLLAISWCGHERVPDIAASSLGTKITVSVAWFIPAYMVNVLINICKLRYIAFETGESSVGCVMSFCWSCYGVSLLALLGMGVQERWFGYSSRKRGYQGITRRQYGRIVVGVGLLVVLRGVTMSTQSPAVRVLRALSLTMYPCITFLTVPIRSVSSAASRPETLSDMV